MLAEALLLLVLPPPPLPLLLLLLLAPEVLAWGPAAATFCCSMGSMMFPVGRFGMAIRLAPFRRERRT